MPPGLDEVIALAGIYIVSPRRSFISYSSREAPERASRSPAKTLDGKNFGSYAAPMKIYVRFNTWIHLDDEDAELALAATRRWKYSMSRAHHGKWTNLAWAKDENGKNRIVRLGRFIAGFPEGKYVTYINKDRKNMRRSNLKVGGIPLDLKLPPDLSLDLVNDLTCRKIVLKTPAPTPKVDSAILPGGARHFVPDPTSKLGPVIQYKIWLKRTGQQPRGSTHA